MHSEGGFNLIIFLMNHTKQELLYIPHSIKLQSPPFQNLDFKARFVIKRDHRYVTNFTFGKLKEN